jgi:multicomponent Na+:H+ antiporter subunit E
MKTRSWFVAAFVFALIWVFVSGPEPAPLPVFRSFVFGLVVGTPVAYVFRRLYEEEIDVRRSTASFPYVFLYAAVFTKEIIVANLDVAYRVVSPEMPLEPQVIFVPLRVQTSLGVTTIANSITITPGTVTLDHDPDENGLYVHTIDGRDPDDVVEPIREWEDYALLIFDEEMSPADTPREIRVHPPDYPPEPKTVTEGGDEDER